MYTHYTHTCTYIYIHIHIHIHIYIYIYTHTYTYTYTYIYMINSKIKCNYPIVAIFVINFTLMIIFCTRNMVGFLKMGATKTDRKGTGLELAFNNFHFPAILIIRKALKVDSPLLRWLTAWLYYFYGLISILAPRLPWHPELPWNSHVEGENEVKQPALTDHEMLWYLV